MDLQHVNIKIPVQGDLNVPAERFIGIFHNWIKDDTLDELLIDVADYRHVPAGPGVMLIGHEADFSMDHAGNRWGLRYNRKAPLPGSNEDRFHQALKSAAHACCLLESELAKDGPLTFSRKEFELFINDRALAPNTPETYAACKPQLEAFVQSVLGHGEFNLTHVGDSRTLFRVTVTASKPFDLTAIAESR